MVRVRSLGRSAAFGLPAAAATPLVKWAGGKRSLRRQLLALAPARFLTFVEPFVGGASFFLSLASPRTLSHAVLNDANCELMEMYRATRDDPEALMAELDLLQRYVLDERFYYELRNNAPRSPIKQAARFIYLNKTCYNGLYRVNRHGQFNVPFGRYASPPALYNRRNVLEVAKLLQRADLRCGDFTEALSDAGPDDFAYLDPPYVPLTQTASFTGYTKGAFGDADQRRLADTVHDLTERGCKVLLSNSETALVRELYGGDRYRISVLHAPRSINSDAHGRHKIPELAIRNYDDIRGECCADGPQRYRPTL